MSHFAVKSLLLSLICIFAALFLPQLIQEQATFNAWLSPAEIVLGPGQQADNPFHVLGEEPNLIGYIANVNTYAFVGSALDALEPLPAPVLEHGMPGTFDSCGAWLNSTWQDGNVIRGWYHAETDCDYPTTRKSVAYTESYDGGRTFVKPGYPYNQVITAPLRFRDPAIASEGDHHVIQVGEYLHLYFRAVRDGKVHLARSHISDKGLPGTWFKLYNGEFTQPGIGGESSPIAPDLLALSWVSYNSSLKMYMGFSRSRNGFGLVVSPDGVTKWQKLSDLVLAHRGEWWNRGVESGELFAYPSLIGLDGSSTNVSSVFWLYYMQLRPGDAFRNGRFLVRRQVMLSRAEEERASLAATRIALSRYERSDPPEVWVTTTDPSQDYEYVTTLGYLFTEQKQINMKPLYDCYFVLDGDYRVEVDESCGVTDSRPVRNLRLLGWIATVPFTNAQGIFQCFDSVNNDHFVSTDDRCEGKGNGALLGYIDTLATQESGFFE